jgi:uncharacterized coiled-coil DUF342 family protein
MYVPANLRGKTMATDLEQVLSSITELGSDIKELKTETRELKTETQELKTETQELKTEMQNLKVKTQDLQKDIEISNTKFDNYQKASQSLVNLAFSLIASATVVTVVSSVFRR